MKQKFSHMRRPPSHICTSHVNSVMDHKKMEKKTYHTPFYDYLILLIIDCKKVMCLI